MSRPGSTVRRTVLTVDGQKVRKRADLLATEEPLAIRIGDTDVSVTMRTPGHDFELAAGFLYTEGIVHPEDLAGVRYCVSGDQLFNVVTVDLRPGATWRAPDRNFYAASGCGLCGKASLDEVRRRGLVPPGGCRLTVGAIRQLPTAFERAQALFARTGGLHGAALFDEAGALVEMREDVGRHNAVDKLVGWALLQRKLPLERHMLMVSGRVGFEIMQKAVSAGIPALISVSAPSSLAVDLAHETGVTLIGFLRGDRFNVYSGAERIEGLASDSE